jgi:hypothetical protein
MQPIVSGSVRRHWGTISVVASCLVALGVVLIGTNHHSVVGWVSVVVFGACGLLAAWQFHEGRPRVVIDDRGVLDRTFAIGTIPWDDIRAVHVKRLQGHAHLCLDLKQTGKYTGRLSPMLRRVVALNRELGLTDLSVNLDGVSPDPEQVEALIRAELATRL